MKVIAWNIARRERPWRELLKMDADIALLSEATPPPADIAGCLNVDPAPWRTAGAGVNRPWRTAVAKLSNRAQVEWLEPKPVAEASPGDLAVSRIGTLAAAVVTPTAADPFVVVSMYAAWEKPHSITGSGWIYADGSAHRLLSDLSALIGQQSRHRILVAGDLNILYGYGEGGSAYWAARYATVFDRMKMLGFSFVGPQAPAGLQADPWPAELPVGSRNVPTYHTSHQTPATAARQLDFVFASTGLAADLSVCALNEIEQWGPSDHCPIQIEFRG